MVTQIWRRRRAEPGAETTEPARPTSKRTLTRQRPSAPTAPGRTEPRRVFTRRRPVESVPTTVLVDRRTARRWSGRRHNLVSATIWLAALATALVLLLGILLTFAGANPDNVIIHTIIRAGAWLASPFHDVFLNPDPDRQLYINWGIAAAAYLLVGRTLSWLVRR
jgi:hypothetical protein